MSDPTKESKSKISSMAADLLEKDIFETKERTEGEEPTMVFSDPTLRGMKGIVRPSGDYMVVDHTFYIKKGLYKVLERNIKTQTSTLLLGPTGVGKTEMVANLATVLKKEVMIFDMGTMSDPIMGLVGSHILHAEEGKVSSKFSISRFAEAIQRPGIILMDEINRASAQANNLLFPCLDFRKELAMEYNFEDRTPIKVHPECMFIATANVGSQYTGTHKLDKALQDRFMMIEIDPLEKDAILSLLAFEFPSVDKEYRNKIVNFYFALDKAHQDYTVGFNMSLRHLKLIMGLTRDGFVPYDAIYTICKGIGGPEGVKALSTILEQLK